VNRTMSRFAIVLGLASAATSAQTVNAGSERAVAPLKPVSAAASPIATQAMMLGAAWAGNRAVSVGEHGVVLLSDDDGTTFRQARQVPVSSTLTSVTFIDAQHGWAVGHWGAILATADGGETWQIQRLAAEEDRPLFAVQFVDAQHGVAVGLWSLVLVTADAGRTWAPRTLNPLAGANKADLNLLSLFADSKGALYATAERGQVLRSEDRGQNWEYLNTGYNGSLWSGTALDDRTLLVGGQRGTLLRSGDGGKTWERVPLESKSSITTVVSAGPDVLVGGLEGLQALSRDRGQHFSMGVSPGAVSLTAALATKTGRWILLSRRGVLATSPK